MGKLIIPCCTFHLPSPCYSFTASGDVGPRTTRTEIDAALCVIGAGRDVDFDVEFEY